MHIIELKIQNITFYLDAHNAELRGLVRLLSHDLDCAKIYGSEDTALHSKF